MNRLINNRPICFAALSLATGLFLTGIFINYKFLRLIFIGVALITIGFLFISDKAKFSYIPAFFVLGILLLSVVNDVYRANAVNVKNAAISGTISTEIVENENGCYFRIENVSVNGSETKKSAYVWSYSLPDARAGDKVNVTGDISTYDLDYRNFNVYGFDDVRYSVYARKIEYAGEGKLGADSRFMVNLKRKLYENCDDDTVSTTTALLFGDKFGVDSAYIDNVKNAGLTHVFAVSGLHVGMLAAVTAFLARKLKRKKALYITIIEIPLVLYAWLCGFGASTVRAIIMSTIAVFAAVSGKKRDGLNSIAFAGIVVMTVMPYSVFMPGFHMSFDAVLALSLAGPYIKTEGKGFLVKLKNLAVSSLSVNYMLFPLLSGFFGEIQTLFIISNLLILPILPFMYVISLVICLFVSIIPQTAVLLKALNVILFPIKFVAETVGGLAISSVSAPALGMLGFAFLGVTVISSRFVFLTRFKKAAVSLVFIAVCIAAIPLISLL